MKLFMVEVPGWGNSFTIVRTMTQDSAIAVAKAGKNAEVVELEPEGEEGIVWNWDRSPDTPHSNWD